MNYFEQISIYTDLRGIEYKKIRLQEYKVGYHKASNKFFINGKQVRKHERWICEDTLDNANPSKLVETDKKWKK